MKKPLKGYTSPLITRYWDVQADHSHYVDHVAKRKRFRAAGKSAPYNSYGKGEVRQMGVARIRLNHAGTYTHDPQFVVYAHSQVTDSPYFAGHPAAYFMMDREEAEMLVSNLLRVLMD